MGATIKAASVAIFDEGKVLLVLRAHAPFAGCWTLPGGKCAPGEVAEACARREISEELSLELGELLPVSAISPLPHYELEVFCAREHGGSLWPSAEIAGWRWVRADDLAGLKTTEGLAEVLRQALTVVEN